MEAVTDSINPRVPKVEMQIKNRLEKLGYDVRDGLGGADSSIALAIYDKASDKYLLGIQLDTNCFKASQSALERDVYKPKFLESRGWTLHKVWVRDFWLSPTRVIKSITSAADKNR